MRSSSLLALLMLLFVSCAPAIPRDVREGAAKEITVREVQRSPQDYQGRSVLWGGKILRAENRKEGTVLEILQLPLGGSDRPRQVDQTSGRFLFLYPRYLDKAIYAEGREVTVVGTITGIEEEFLDRIVYPYPFVEGKAIHLWERRQETYGPPYYDYPPRFWGPPYWGRHPLWW